MPPLTDITPVPHRPTPPKGQDFPQAVLSPPLEPGEIGRFGDYRVLGILGQGGMGVVLEGEEISLGRKVALKLIRPDVPEVALARDRFLREARAAAAVEHPRVVIIYRVGEEQGTPFIAMKLMKGMSLAKRLDGKEPLPIAETLRYAKEAMEGLAAAHALGLIHRDIKPDNIWLEENTDGLHVRLLDFGLARGDESSPLTRAGTIMGTPAYMAPEQAAGAALDARADLFSMGCVLYEMATGQKAFQGSSVMAILSALANHQPPSAVSLRADMPAALSQLIDRLLAKNRDERPASAQAAVLELDEIERQWSAPIVLGGTTTVLPARPLRRPRRLTAVGITAACGLALGLFLAPPWKAKVYPEPTAPVVHPAATAFRVVSLEVNHFARQANGDDALMGALGKQSFAAVQGDKVQVEAKLSKPGYAYVIAFRPDKVADLCYPADEATPPPLSDWARYPEANSLKGYGLREGTGLWVFAVVASEEPLPAFRDWAAANLKSWDWPTTTDASGTVWVNDGQWTQAATVGGMSTTVRGKDEELIGPVRNFQRLTEVLHGTKDIQSSSAVGFCVKPN